MKEIIIEGSNGTSRLVAGAPFHKLWELAPKDPSVLVVDTAVKKLYPHIFHNCAIIEIPGGEETKSLNTVEELLGRFLHLGLDRSAHVVALGGGCVCDVTAFAASIYMRGLITSIIPTTLLAQIDAGVGGKNGVNFEGFKNIVGTIRQPALVLCDPGFLRTLSKKELQNGFAEAIKHAVIADVEYFKFLREQLQGALSLQSETLERVIYDSLAIKAAIVGRDELESGERMKLNFGHTLGHAIEATAGLSHGEAVSIGMAAEAKLSLKRGMITEQDYQALLDLLSRYNLPVKLINGDALKLKDAMQRDKKRKGKTIGITLLQGIGKSLIEEVPMQELEELVDVLCVAR